ncbi:hypothetical protein LTR27_009446 [Elasticomyces elasticus]|nr:hypothetical protein LTR27_009446 [Elasticomyces elasticus]
MACYGLDELAQGDLDWNAQNMSTIFPLYSCEDRKMESSEIIFQQDWKQERGDEETGTL